MRYNKKKSMLIILLILILGLAYLWKMNKNDNSINVNSQDLSIKRYLGLNKSNYNKFTGKNVCVAIIDSGISFHKDLVSNRVIAFKDFVGNKETPYDDFGHGTFVAGLIGANGKLRGISPNVNFVIVKALDNKGNASRETLNSAIEWIINNKEKYDIKIVNISEGVSPILPYNEDPICIQIAKLKKKGVIIVCSAGNEGPRENTIVSPGISPDVITVGSINNKNTYTVSDDTVAKFSSRGNYNSGVEKPNFVTMGVDLMSLDYKRNSGYTIMSGTSFSTAIVSGVAAILIEKYSTKPISFVENMIKKSTYSLDNIDYNSQGRGELLLN